MADCIKVKRSNSLGWAWIVAANYDSSVHELLEGEAAPEPDPEPDLVPEPEISPEPEMKPAPARKRRRKKKAKA